MNTHGQMKVVEPEHNMSHRVDTFYVLDFDRCIADTTKLHKLLEDCINAQGSIAHDEIEAARKETEQSGGSFDAGSFIRDAFRQKGKEALWEELVEYFIAEAQKRDDLLEPGAHEFIEALVARKLPFGILTYGGKVWQEIKLRAVKLEHIPVIITDIKQKGRVFASWQREAGDFALPAQLSGGDSVIADTLLLLDDKAVSFDGIPAGVRGFQVLPIHQQELLLSQRGVLPAGIYTVRGLYEAGEAIGLL